MWTGLLNFWMAFVIYYRRASNGQYDMKLINIEFDHRLINDNIRDKKGRVRLAKTKYPQDPDAIDFEETEKELESLLGHAYHNERNRLPAKLGMRKQCNGKHVTVDWWDERPGGSGNYEWHNFHNRLYGLVEKYVGKKFDDCFAALKERYMTDKDWRRQACGVGNRRSKRTNLWMGIRDQFLSIFEWSRYLGDYFVDDEGLIQKRPAKPKRHNRDIHRYEGEVYYVPNYGAIKDLADKLAKAKVDIVNYHLPIKVTIEFVQRWESSFPAYHFNYWEIQQIKRACFHYIDKRTCRVIKYHSPEWYEIKGRSGKRKRKKIDRSAYYDRSLWVSDYLRHHDEAGVYFHSLMENDLATIRRSRIIDVANTWIRDVPPYKAITYGADNYRKAIVAVMESEWLDRTCKEVVWDASFQLDMAIHEYLNPGTKNSDED